MVDKLKELVPPDICVAAAGELVGKRRLDKCMHSEHMAGEIEHDEHTGHDDEHPGRAVLAVSAHVHACIALAEHFGGA